MKQGFWFYILIFVSVASWSQDEEWRKFVPEQYRGNPEYEAYYRKHYENWKAKQDSLKKANPKQGNNIRPNKIDQGSFQDLDDALDDGGFLGESVELESDIFEQPDLDEGLPKIEEPNLETATEDISDFKQIKDNKKWRLLAFGGAHMTRMSLNIDTTLNETAGPPAINPSFKESSGSGLGYFGSIGLERKFGKLISARSLLLFNRYYYTGNNIYTGQSEKIDFKYFSLEVGPMLYLYPLESDRMSFYFAADARVHYLMSATEVDTSVSSDLAESNFKKLMFGALFAIGANYETRKGIEGLNIEVYYEMVFGGPYGDGYIADLESTIEDDPAIASGTVDSYKSNLSAYGLRVGYFYNF